jgi:tetratricopeptide (TPR) repeat protein
MISQQLFSQQNFIDSMDLFLSNKSTEIQLKEILAIPYDKWVANPTQSEKLFLKALEKNKELNHKETEADLYNQLSLIYAFLGNYDKRLDCNLKAIKIYESIGNKNKAGKTYGNLGFSMYRRDLEKAKAYMRKGIHLLEEVNDLVELNATYDNYGILQEISGNTDSAIYYYNLALDLKINQKDSIGIPYALSHLSGVYIILKDFKKAKKYLDESYSIRKKRNDTYGIAECLTLYADFYYAQNNYNNAISYLLDCYAITNEKSYDHMRQYILLQLSDCYEKNNDLASALKYQKLYIELKDKLLNESTSNKIAQLEIQYDTEKKEKEIKLLNAENELKIRDINKKKMQRNISLVGLSLIILLAIYISYHLLEKKKVNKLLAFQNEEITSQKAIIEDKNKDITDSIRYAKRIQNAILPQQKIINQLLPNSFVFYKPKDIVAGDFYWMESLPLTPSEGGGTPFPLGRVGDGIILFAAADCTGHGVPGAMVSVVCSNALNRATKEFKLTNPGKILDKVRELVEETFEKSDEDVKDGMDIALCSLEFKVPSSELNQLEIAALLQYAGANNPLWVIRPLRHCGLDPQTVVEIPHQVCNDGSFELIEYKPNKQPIGKIDNPLSFVNHTVELQKNDSIYILTDGYADQFGGEKGKKLKYKPLKELLISIQHLTMDEQKLALETHFNNWKGNLEQVDDVCIIGVRI